MDSVSFGKRLKELRVARGLSVEELSEQIGKNSDGKYIRMLENGSRRPSIYTLLSIANLLECSLDYLLAADLTFHSGDSFEKDILSRMQALSPKQLAVMNVVIKEFQKQNEE